MVARLRLAVHELAQRRHLGPQGMRLALGGGPRGACLGLAARGVGPGGLGLGQRGLGAGGQIPRCHLCRLRRPERRAGGGQCLPGRRLGAAGACGFRLGAVQGQPGVGQKSLRRLVAGDKPRGILGQPRQPGLD